MDPPNLRRAWSGEVLVCRRTPTGPTLAPLPRHGIGPFGPLKGAVQRRRTPRRVEDGKTCETRLLGRIWPEPQKRAQATEVATIRLWGVVTSDGYEKTRDRELVQRRQCVRQSRPARPRTPAVRPSCSYGTSRPRRSRGPARAGGSERKSLPVGRPAQW